MQDDTTMSLAQRLEALVAGSSHGDTMALKDAISGEAWSTSSSVLLVASSMCLIDLGCQEL